MNVKVLNFPERQPIVRCESGDPTCGPVRYEDDEGVPLCKECYESLETETPAQRRARELGLSVIGADDGGSST